MPVEDNAPWPIASGYRLGCRETRATGHIRMLAASGILAADLRADVMNPALPAILGGYFVEPGTGDSRWCRAGSFPHPVGERVVLPSDPPHFSKYVRAIQRPPERIIRLRELIMVVEKTAAVSALAAGEIFHAGRQPQAGLLRTVQMTRRDGGSENTPAYGGQLLDRRWGLLQFANEAKAQVLGADRKHLLSARGHPQTLVMKSAGYNRSIAENQWKEFEEKAGLRGVLAKIGSNGRQGFLRG